jgi:hypothetical protein
MHLKIKDACFTDSEALVEEHVSDGKDRRKKTSQPEGKAAVVYLKSGEFAESHSLFVFLD